MHRVVGELDLADTRLDAAGARAILRDLIRVRRFDERAIALQRRGWMSGYPPFSGQEGSQVGVAHAMADDDWLIPTYRSNAMQLARGVPMSDVLVFRRGQPAFDSGHDVPVFPESITVGTQVPQATGVGMAMVYAGAEDAVVCCLGDGATSTGDFHEGMNFAGVFEAPVVFLCENNGWAISTPRERQTASETIAEKASAYGVAGIQVDGNDAFAVYEVVAESIERAREGEPVLVESLTYRRGPHTTADDPSRYRPEHPDLPEWRTADPVARARDYLMAQGVVDDGFVEDVGSAAESEIDEAVAAAEAVPPGGPDELFDSTFETLPPALVDQREWLRSFVEEHGDFDEIDL
jgi:pyruvate dehydrogenase E1 component alpha subunit